MTDLSDVLTISEAALEFGLRYDTLIKAVRQGRVESRQSGSTWLTTRAAIRAAVEAGRLRPPWSDRERLERGFSAPCADCGREVKPGEAWQSGIYDEVYCPRCAEGAWTAEGDNFPTGEYNGE